MKKLIMLVGFVGTIALGAGGIWAWQYYNNANDIDDANFSGDAFAANDLTNAYKNKILPILPAWVPQLPVMPNQFVPDNTQGVFPLITISSKYNHSAIPARNADYLNPAQFYASTSNTGKMISAGGADVGVLN